MNSTTTRIVSGSFPKDCSRNMRPIVPPSPDTFPTCSKLAHRVDRYIDITQAFPPEQHSDLSSSKYITCRYHPRLETLILAQRLLYRSKRKGWHFETLLKHLGKTQRPHETTVTASDEVQNRMSSSHRSSEERHTERYLENRSNDTTHVTFGELEQNNMALTLLDVSSNRILSGFYNRTKQTTTNGSIAFFSSSIGDPVPSDVPIISEPEENANVGGFSLSIPILEQADVPFLVPCPR